MEYRGGKSVEIFSFSFQNSMEIFIINYNLFYLIKKTNNFLFYKNITIFSI